MNHSFSSLKCVWRTGNGSVTAHLAWQLKKFISLCSHRLVSQVFSTKGGAAPHAAIHLEGNEYKNYCTCSVWSAVTALGKVPSHTKGAGRFGAAVWRCQVVWAPCLRGLAPNQHISKAFEVSSCWQCCLRSVNRHSVSAVVMEGFLVPRKGGLSG